MFRLIMVTLRKVDEKGFLERSLTVNKVGQILCENLKKALLQIMVSWDVNTCGS